jgi:hypothetical protein
MLVGLLGFIQWTQIGTWMPLCILCSGRSRMIWRERVGCCERNHQSFNFQSKSESANRRKLKLVTPWPSERKCGQFWRP